MNSKIGPKEALLRAQREARASAPRNTPEASGTARKAPSGEVVSAPAPMAKPSRNSVRASPPIPERKQPKAKTGTAVVKGHVRRSTTGAGLRVGEAAAEQPKRGRGRPKATGPRKWEIAGISRAEWYRRKAEERSK